MTTHHVYIHEEVELNDGSTSDTHWCVGTYAHYEDGEACCAAIEACGIPSTSIEMVEAEWAAEHPEQYGIER